MLVLGTQTKVSHLDGCKVTGILYQNVVWLQIPMHNSICVQVVNSFEYSFDNQGCFFICESSLVYLSLFDHCGESSTIHQLHSQEYLTLDLSYLH